jgi:hypothetical protein
MSIELIKAAQSLIERWDSPLWKEARSGVYIARLREAVDLASRDAAPIAAVTGYHGGHCVIEPIDRAMLLPVGMALYSGAQAAVPEDLRATLFSGWQGCSNHGCMVRGQQKGMGTNGQCKCLVDASRTQLQMLQGRLQSMLATEERTE